MAASKAVREATTTLARLRKAHPDAECALRHGDPFQLLVATVLSAQTTDVNVNKVTPVLFERWPDARALASAPPADVERVIGSLGFFRQKTKSIVGLSKKIVAEHGGRVPETLAELVTLPGVGRKTANVVLGVAFGKPEGVVVDTHVQRISQRLGWTKHKEPEKIERDLMKIFPQDDWDPIGHTLIFHGRRICSAARPACAACPVNDVCPCAFKAEKVGRKPGRVRPAAERVASGQRSQRRRAPSRKKPRAASPSAKNRTTERPKSSRAARSRPARSNPND